MIADGARACFQCATVLEFHGGHLAAVQWSAAPCLGCERWVAILEDAKRLAAEQEDRQTTPELVELTPSAIYERLTANRRRDAVRDHAMAAAGDRE